MATVTIEELNKEAKKKNLPKFKAGQTVKVYQKIKEGEKERVQMFQGLIIEVSGGTGISGSITVRRIVDGIGVEKIFPIHSPFIEKFELVKEAKVRHSRIFFMRQRSGKSARLQERFYTDAELSQMTPHEVTEEEVEEAIVHDEEEKKKTEEEAVEKGEVVAEVTQPEEEEEEGEEKEEEKAETKEEEVEEKKEEAVVEESKEEETSEEVPEEKAEEKDEKDEDEEEKS